MSAIAVGMASVTGCATDSPQVPNAIGIRGTAEIFVYSEKGYTGTFPVVPQRPNAAGSGLRISTELRAAGIPRLLMFEDALVLLGDSRGADDAKYNIQPTSILGRYGLGAEIRRGVQLRLTHGEGYDVDDLKTTGAPWNSISLRFQRLQDAFHGDSSRDFLEIHLYPPHNEYDPSPLGPFSQRRVARYGVQFAKKIFVRRTRGFIFTEPFLLFGDSRPQTSYTYGAKPLAALLVYGAGFALTRSAQVRLTQGQWRNLGGYNGPTRSWSGLSLRYGW